MNTEATTTLDARNLNCPLPILKAKKALNTLQKDETLAIQATDPGSVQDFRSFCEQTGNILVSSDSIGDEYSFIIKKA